MRSFRSVVGWAIVTGWALLIPSSAWAASAVFGGGPFYAGGTAVMNTVRNSGFTTVMLWSIHVDSNTGDLILNDQKVASGGAYVGASTWPAQLATLKQAPTSVKRIEISVGSWGVNDFQSIKTLMAAQGTGTNSILYRNFLALKNATGADAVDLDDETLYDATSTVQFCLMCASMGYKITLCPYTNTGFWQSCFNQINSQRPGTVDAIYLQCYDGGAGNNPASWNSVFGGFKVYPGMWCSHGNNCADGNNPASVAAQMTAWKNSAGITGGFMWLFDDMQSCSSSGTPAQYASAINGAVALPPPSGLTVNPGSNALLLSWNSVPGATSYNVRRASTLTGSLTQIATGVTNTYYWDRGLTVGNRWYYEVDSVSSVGEGNYSALVSGIVGKGALPSGWTNQDIGSVALAGSVTCNGNVFVVQGSGTDIWNQVDAFNFTSTQVSGDSALIGRVFVLQGADSWTKAGLMFRNDSTPSSLFVDMVATPGNGVSFQWRDASGQCNSATVSGVAVPAWLQLVRSGNAFTGYCSTNGTSWTQVGTTALSMNDTLLSGLALTAHNDTALATAVIDNVGSGAPVIIQQPSPISATRFVGANYTLAVGASAALPVSYFWSKDGVFLSSATNSVVALTNLALSDSGSYAAIISNAFGVVTSSVVSLSVQATSNAPYAGVVMAGHPIGYWRLNETSGKTAYDWVGGNDGTYTNVVIGQPGYNLLDTRRSARFGFTYVSNSFVGNIPIDFATAGNAQFSIEAWVNAGAQTNDSGIVTKGTGAGGEQFNLDCGSGNSHAFRFFVRDAAGNVHLANSSFVPNSKWHHLVGVCDEANGAVILYVDGTNVAQGSITAGNGLQASANAMTIGSRQSGTTAYDSQLNGYIEDVAVYNSALSATQVRTHYQTATNRPPVFLTNPFTTPPATVGATYSAYIGTDAYDPNGDLVIFSQVSGPAWLTIASDGSLSGTPSTNDVGLNVFQLSARDPAGLSNSATLNLTVMPAITAFVSIQGTNLSLQWQGGVSPYQVQTTTNLVPALWENVGDPVDSNTFLLAPSNSAGFYRIQGQ